MIPLAQYLSDMNGDEFVPLRAVERRPAPSFPADRAYEFRGESGFVRPLKPMTPRPAMPAAAVLPQTVEESVPASEMRSARAAWASEKKLLEEAAEAARTEAAAAREAELRAEMETAGERRLAALRAELEAGHADALAAERDRWTEAQADRLADLMILQMAVFEDTMRATVRNVLRPLAMDARQRRALEDLADAVKVIAPEGGEYKLAATGPSDLLARFREKLGDQANRLSVKPDESRVDIRVDADATTIETRLSAWGKALEKALS